MGAWTTKDLQERGLIEIEPGKFQKPVFNTEKIQNRINELKGKVIFLVAPCSKPRMTRSDKWKKRPAVIRYRQFCDDFRAVALEQNFTLPDSNFHITFYLPIPKTHLKRELEGKPHQQKPDVDNMVKAVFDAMNKADQSIYDFRASKYYSAQPRITFERIA